MVSINRISLCSILVLILIVNTTYGAVDTTFYKKYTEYLNQKQSPIVKELYGQPEQIHINYGLTADQMMITWITLDLINDSVVEYGPKGLSNRVNGTYTLFTDGGSEHRTMNVHRVLLTNLTPGETYIYHCGSPTWGWSSLFYFTALNSSKNFAPRFAVFGDMGNINAKSLTSLQEETVLGYYDAVLHVGDFAYDMNTDNARVGDAFMNQIQPVAAYLPYMTCPGNHENAYNFSNYFNKFSMPGADGTFGGDNNHFFSINIGPVHLIGFSTEFYYFIEYGLKQIKNQYEWLKRDLENANRPENREKQPWIVTMGHRPMYCTNADNDDCTKFDDRVRTGLPFIGTFGLEKLFYDYGVDVEFWAHEHSYERLWPIYDFKVLNGSTKEPYVNPRAPVHITTGSAGCQENHDAFGDLKNFTAFRANDYGYTRMNVYNASHMYFEQVSVDLDGKIIDSFWLIKNKHGPYN